MKKVILGIILMAALLSPTQARADVCPTFDLNNLFFEEYFPNNRWSSAGTTRTITWTTAATTFPVLNKPVTAKFSTNEEQWLQETFNSQDEILDSVIFKKVSTADADITVGYGEVDEGALAWWNAWWDTSTQIRYKATIRVSTKYNYLFLNRLYFVQTMQHELRNVLGMGDIRASSKIDSIQEDPYRPRTSTVVLDDDFVMLRQHYGESTCLSNSPMTKYKAQLQVEAEARAKAEAEALQAKAAREAQILAEATAEYEAAVAAVAEALLALEESEAALKQSEG